MLKRSFGGHLRSGGHRAAGRRRRDPRAQNGRHRRAMVGHQPCREKPQHSHPRYRRLRHWLVRHQGRSRRQMRRHCPEVEFGRGQREQRAIPRYAVSRCRHRALHDPRHDLSARRGQATRNAGHRRYGWQLSGLPAFIPLRGGVGAREGRRLPIAGHRLVAAVASPAPLVRARRAGLPSARGSASAARAPSGQRA